jgi:hypothetical protein
MPIKVNHPSGQEQPEVVHIHTIFGGKGFDFKRRREHPQTLGREL